MVYIYRKMMFTRSVFSATFIRTNNKKNKIIPVNEMNEMNEVNEIVVIKSLSNKHVTFL